MLNKLPKYLDRLANLSIRILGLKALNIIAQGVALGINEKMGVNFLFRSFNSRNL